MSSYDSWKLASPEEGVDLGDWESDATTAVEELCVHGEHPIECSLCTSAGFHAAVSGEEEDVTENTEDTFDMQLRLLLESATDLEVKRGRYAFDREEKRRIEAAEATIRALDPNAPKQRKTRKDAGTTRPRKTEAA